MNVPPETLLRLTRFLGSEPSRAASRKQCWFSLIGGAALVIWSACLLLLFWKEHEDGTTAFLGPTMIVMGLMLAAQGAAGLLGEDRRGLSLWLSALGALLFVPFVFLAGAVLYASMGVLGAGAWAMFLVLMGVWDEARRRRRAL